jgi:hypothetical protein
LVRGVVFDDPYTVLAFVIALAVGVALLIWWQDFDGIHSTWEYRRLCRTRERLSGEEFFQRFYQASGIPPELVIGFRQFHADYWGEVPELLRPEDDLFRVNAGADFADWLAKTESLFGVVIRWETKASGYDMPDATFDSLLRLVHRKRPPLSPLAGGI